VPETTKKFGYAVGGLIVGGLLAYAALQTMDRAEDEDRPPIIVRGGSIIFQSGDPESSDSDERPGKPWLQDGAGDWQPDQPSGKKSKWFSIAIRGAVQCPALSMTKEVTVTYTAADNTESRFTFTFKERPTSTRSPAPAIRGTGLTVDNSGANQTLTYGTAGQGRISRVQFQGQGVGNVNCADPVSLKIWAH
jgi:hypothetical protein